MIKTLIFIAAFLLYIGANIYIALNISKRMPINSVLKYGITVLIISGVASFFLYLFLHDVLPFWFSKFLFFCGTTWLTFFVYLFMVTIASSILLFINKYTHLFSQSALLHYTRENTLSLILVLVFICLLLLGGYFKYLWKQQVKIPIQLAKEVRTDSIHGDSIKIVAISDLHLGYGIGANELSEWVRLINNEQPDAVIISGDIVDISTKPLFKDSLYEYFRRIEAPLGIYTCLGNHEYYAGIHKSARFFKKAGIHLLRDSATLVDSTFYIVGRDDKTNSKRKPLCQLVAGLDQSKPIILLDHQPYDLEESEKNNIDLQFSGHTHNGQIWPGPLLENWLYEDAYGFLKKGKTSIYISSGIGIWGGKFRIGTQSEFVIFNIKGKKELTNPHI